MMKWNTVNIIYPTLKINLTQLNVCTLYSVHD